MRARDLCLSLPTVTIDDDALAAARAMAAARDPGLIVLDESQRPVAVLPGSQVLRTLVPAYVQDDPALARALDESGSDDLVRRLTTQGVRELINSSGDRRELPVVDGDATALEIAAVMARMHSPLVAVVDGGRYVGAITVSGLLTEILGSIA